MKSKFIAVAFILVSTSFNLFAQPKDNYSLPSRLSLNQSLTSSDTHKTLLDVEKNIGCR
jgi:hypothetical protein